MVQVQVQNHVQRLTQRTAASSSVAVLAIATIMGAAMSATPAAAAVRRCDATITAGGEDTSNETMARQKAMAAWIARASTLGPAYSAWRIAIERKVACQKQASRGFLCIIAAKPCTIVQSPDATPPNTQVPNTQVPGVPPRSAIRPPARAKEMVI